jgi:hypothetical protein
MVHFYLLCFALHVALRDGSLRDGALRDGSKD